MKKNLLTMTAFIILVFGYQNCSEITVGKFRSLNSSFKLQSLVCPLEGETTASSAKVMFVVDMSLSNLGGVRAIPLEPFGYLLIPGYMEDPPPNPVTDCNMPGCTARRLELVNNLITNLPDHFKYSVLGFGTSVLQGPQDNCGLPFQNSATALLSTQYLVNVQNHDYNLGSPQTTGTSPFFMSDTSYDAAITCLNTKIRTDVTNSPGEMGTYHVFFITDGQPTDPPEAQGTYGSRIQALQDDLSDEIGMFRFQPVYYGADAEEAAAVAILNTMATPGLTTITSDNFDDLEDQFEGSFTSTASQPYRIVRFGAVNLTAKPSNGFLEADPTLSQLRTVIDGMQTYDLDRDLVPDFLERIRGMRDDIPDTISSDSDGDGISNLIELSQGSDVLSVVPFRNSDLIASSYGVVSGQYCGNNQEKYSFSLSQMPIVSVGGFVDPGGTTPLDFSHGENENLIMLYYIAEPTTSTGTKLLFVNLFRKQIGEIILSSEMGEFIQLGEMR